MDDLERRLAELPASVLGATSPTPAMEKRVSRRVRTRRIATVVASLCLVALASAAVAPALPLWKEPQRSTSAAADWDGRTTAEGLDFEPASGWHVRTGGPDAASGGQAWTANVPFSADEAETGESGEYAEGWPDETEDALPPDGILIVAKLALQTRNPLPAISAAPVRELPLTLDQPPVAGGELHAPDRATAMVRAVVQGRYLEVGVVFGTARPSDALVKRAEDALARMVVPPPPSTTDELDDFGVEMDLGPRWEGVLFSWNGMMANLNATTVPPLDVYDGSSARERLEVDDVFMVLAENDAYAVRYEEVNGHVSIRPEDLCATCEILDGGSPPPPTHSLFYRPFSRGGRQFDLFVEFGRPDPSADDLAAVNEMLATLQVHPAPTPSAGVTG